METFPQGASQGIIVPENTLENAAPHPAFTGKRKSGQELELQALCEAIGGHLARHRNHYQAVASSTYHRGEGSGDSGFCRLSENPLGPLSEPPVFSMI